jgi:hypothetical protein
MCFCTTHELTCDNRWERRKRIKGRNKTERKKKQKETGKRIKHKKGES